MTRWGSVLLIFELFLFVVILIHPDADLPDTAFRDGNSPVLAKLRVTTAPVMAAGIRRISTGSPQQIQAASVNAPRDHPGEGGSTPPFRPNP